MDPLFAGGYPALAIVLFTYEPEGRPRGTAARVLRAALDGIRYSGPLRVHIADDGSPAGHVEELRELAGGYAHVIGVGSTNAQRGGYGRSYNLATQAIHESAGVVLPLEDDWELTRPLDLDPLVETLGRSALALLPRAVSCIRLGYLGFTQRLAGEVQHTPAGIMLALDPDSDEPHVFAGHPRLETVAFEKSVGPWPEGIAAGATEVAVCKRPAARVGIAWPLDLTSAAQDGRSLFAHIGAESLGELEPEGRS